MQILMEIVVGTIIEGVDTTEKWNCENRKKELTQQKNRAEIYIEE